jgi:thrombospondin type 3 repeat protein
VVLDQAADGVTGRVEVFLGAPGGTPVAGQMLPLGTGHAPRTGLLRDLDGDGKADLALADFTGRQVTFFSGVGDGTFNAAGSVPTRGEPSDLTALDLPPAGGSPDLAVLQFSSRLDLLQNGGGLAFAPAPTSPASPWSDTSAMALFGADTLVGIDLVLLQRSAARLDVLSGNGDSVFRPSPTQTIEGLATAPPANASVMQVADLRTDSRPDLAVLDPTAGKVTVLSNDLTGFLVERSTTAITPGALGLSSGTLVASITDIDRDGVVNDLDDCPTIFNPPLCRVTDPACPMEIPCKNTALTPTNCDPGDPATLDPTTQQCDSDRNGIGDHCQVLSENCAGQDSDFDVISDYNSDGLARSSGFLDFDRDGFGNLIDNCPTVSNIDQADVNPADGIGDACEVLSNGQPVDPDDDGVPTFDPATLVLDNCPALPNPSQQDNDADGVGNTCIIDAALDNCPVTININQLDSNGDGVGDACAFAPADLLLANPVAGEVTLLGGDGTGTMHPAAASPLGPLQGPVAAVTGHFALACGNPPTFCFGRTDFDIAVATRGTAGNPSDDGVTAFVGDGMGGFTPFPPVTAGGDPSRLLLAPDQPICTLSNDPARPNLRFDLDRLGDLLALVEPGTPGIRVLVVSNMNYIDPLQSPLIPPVGQPGPLPVPAPLRAVTSLDANRDGRIDLLSLSTPPGGPTVFRLFLGLGNGLFFTDPTLDPAPVQAELDFPATGFINIKVDNVFPDVAAFNVTDRVPNTLFNILPERADIDGSGRVDGFDLAVLAAAFGSERGEDFILLPDATLAQTGTGAARRLLASGTLVPGQDLPDSSGICASGLSPLTGAYGLPVDINLDGIVDGEDLAFLASRFGGAPGP